ncbi:MAG: hypothetical protein Q8926_15600 [Bacteroidota bacterium]|nr:hypothetical protein [Bacteroidota bacterium]
MSSRLEKFVQDHRDQFDDESPSPELWDKIRDRVQPGADPKEEKKETPVRSLPFKRWLSAAAAVVLVCVGGWIYFSLHKTIPAQVLATKVIPPESTVKEQPKETEPAGSTAPTHPELAQTQAAGTKNSGELKSAEPVTPEEADYNEEMYHYARLVEIKHNELKTLQKDEPLLYKKFSGDVKKLDSVYQTLKTKLPENSNREQVIEAMISNLQLQIGLLNKQLNIIKQIKHSKKAAYEKAYKSV